jgi:predicted metal-binding membrane protein
MAEESLRRDRIVTAAGLAVVVALAWVYVVDAAAPSAHAGMSMTMTMAMPGLAWLVGMWFVMMVAMMLPSAAPTILLFSTVSGRRRQQGAPAVPATVFTAGYVLVWGLYATLAAGVQWELHRRLLLSPAMASVSPVLSGGLLVAAGLYQWLPIKRACLSHCRSPLGFLTLEWREGVWGALWMGMRHGTFCVGCCWLLMALLFVAGVMNLAWVVGIAALVLVEKLVRGGLWVGRLAGVAMMVWGVWVIGGVVG